MDFKVSKYIKLRLNIRQNNKAGRNAFLDLKPGGKFKSVNYELPHWKYGMDLIADSNLDPHSENFDFLINRLFTISKDKQSGKFYHMLNLSVYYLPSEEKFIGRVFNIRTRQPFYPVPQEAILVMKMALKGNTAKTETFRYTGKKYFQYVPKQHYEIPHAFKIAIRTNAKHVSQRLLGFISFNPDDVEHTCCIDIVGKNAEWYADSSVDIVDLGFADSDLSPDCGSSLLEYFTRSRSES